MTIENTAATIATLKREFPDVWKAVRDESTSDVQALVKLFHVNKAARELRKASEA
jgi:hypothetical protein